MATRAKTDQQAGLRTSDEVMGYFGTVADHVIGHLRGSEVLTMSFDGEDSSFVRINRAAIRQPGEVRQQNLSLDLIDGSRHARGTTSLSADRKTDLERAGELLERLREQLPDLPEDPHLLYATEVRSTVQHGENRLPDSADAVRHILSEARGLDLVGLWASGGIYNGFANSLGQRNWFSTYTFNFGWSLYHQADKAVKNAHAGFEWDPSEFSRKLAGDREQLDILRHPARSIPPGRYRVYLSPSAMNEILALLSWGGFGLKAQRTRQSSLLRLVEGSARLDPRVSIRENTKQGVAPNFQASGFVKPEQVTMVEKGAWQEGLVSPRSAKEYGVPTNGATDWEFPESIDMAPGDLPSGRILERLGTGLYINNLFYLNYSDRPECRMTGMTRFACFFVEGGRIVAPLNVMRFDDTAYRVLGENLVDLTSDCEMILSSETYGARSTASARLPGIVVDDFTLTL